MTRFEVVSGNGDADVCPPHPPFRQHHAVCLHHRHPGRPEGRVLHWIFRVPLGHRRSVPHHAHGPHAAAGRYRPHGVGLSGRGPGGPRRDRWGSLGEPPSTSVTRLRPCEMAPASLGRRRGNPVRQNLCRRGVGNSAQPASTRRGQGHSDPGVLLSCVIIHTPSTSPTESLRLSGLGCSWASAAVPTSSLEQPHPPPGRNSAATVTPVGHRNPFVLFASFRTKSF